MAWQMVGIADERAREPREGEERDEMGSQAKAGVCVCVSACADLMKSPAIVDIQVVVMSSTSRHRPRKI